MSFFLKVILLGHVLNGSFLLSGSVDDDRIIQFLELAGVVRDFIPQYSPDKWFEVLNLTIYTDP